MGATGALEAEAPVAGIAVPKSKGGAVKSGGPVTLPSNGATVLGWVKVGMVEGAGVFGWVEVGIAVPKSMGGAVKRGGPVTLPSNGAGDMDRPGVGAATGTADGAGVRSSVGTVGERCAMGVVATGRVAGSTAGFMGASAGSKQY
jgi:hypothetical protein